MKASYNASNLLSIVSLSFRRFAITPIGHLRQSYEMSKSLALMVYVSPAPSVLLVVVPPIRKLPAVEASQRPA
jgi:hypothetical protein